MIAYQQNTHHTERPRCCHGYRSCLSWGSTWVQSISKIIKYICVVSPFNSQHPQRLSLRTKTDWKGITISPSAGTCLCEWVISVSCQVNILSAISWDHDVHFNQDQKAQLDFYSATSLKQQAAGKHVAPLGHIILILSQSVFVLSS